MGLDDALFFKETTSVSWVEPSLAQNVTFLGIEAEGARCKATLYWISNWFDSYTSRSIASCTHPTEVKAIELSTVTLGICWCEKNEQFQLLQES